jgi:hypothetical protein
MPTLSLARHSALASETGDNSARPVMVVVAVVVVTARVAVAAVVVSARVAVAVALAAAAVEDHVAGVEARVAAVVM